MTKKFSKDYLRNELCLPYENYVYKHIIDCTRWSIITEIVFEDKGKFYKTTYSEGSTECQDERPWQDIDTVDCVEVELKEIIVKKWVPVK